MRTLRPMLAALVMATTVATSPATADIPYDGWRGQRARPDYAGATSDRRPLDNSPRTGSAYAPPPREPWYPAAAATTRSPMWTGFYLGGHLGGGWGSVEPHDLSSQHISLDGLVGGLHGGYNYQVGSAVLGLEADASLTSVDGTRHYSGIGVAASTSLAWMASLRARVGYAWDNFLAYGTAGIAFSGLDLDVTAGGQSSERERLMGLVWGGGVEMKINPQLSARVEALRTNFRDETFASAAGPVSIGTDATTVRAGLSWHFN